MVNQTPRIVLFDGICKLCNSTVLFIINHDHQARFKFTPLQSEQGSRLIKQFGFQADIFYFIVYIREEKSFTKSTALLYILKDLGGLWKLFYPLIAIPKFIRDFFYDILAKKRYQLFGKLESCMIPKEDIKQRFL
jgi:predicted DCC family thiol-disulfide oxidoreductase YuxK